MGYYAPPVDPGYGKFGADISNALSDTMQYRLQREKKQHEDNLRKQQSSINGVFDAPINHFQLNPSENQTPSIEAALQGGPTPNIFAGQKVGMENDVTPLPDDIQNMISQPGIRSGAEHSPYFGGVGLAAGSQPSPGELIHQAFAPAHNTLSETTEPYTPLEGGAVYVPGRDRRGQQEDRRYQQQNDLFGSRQQAINEREGKNQEAITARGEARDSAREEAKKAAEFSRLRGQAMHYGIVPDKILKGVTDPDERTGKLEAAVAEETKRRESVREARSNKVGYGERKSSAIAHALRDAHESGIDWNSSETGTVKSDLANSIFKLHPELADEGVTPRDIETHLGMDIAKPSTKKEVNVDDIVDKAWARSSLAARPGMNKNDQYRASSRDSTGVNYSPAKAFNDFKNNELPKIPAEHRDEALKRATEIRDKAIADKKKLDETSAKKPKSPSLIDKILQR